VAVRVARWSACRWAAALTSALISGPEFKVREILPAEVLRFVLMQTWEYATVPLLVHVTKQILDSWGEDGWELVAVVPGPNPENVVAYMKRPRESAERK
jgi:hypothetical protein